MATSVKNKTLRILCFGDSLTHGFGFGKQPHPYSNVLRERLAKALPGVKLDIVTDGLPGALASTSGFQRRLKTAFEGESFDWVILLAGTNDLNYDFPPERIFASLKEAWDTALFNNAQVLAMTLPDTPMWAPNSQKSKSKTELNKMILSHQAPN
jgi:lysophospholipase L1-like esterase